MGSPWQFVSTLPVHNSVLPSVVTLIRSLMKWLYRHTSFYSASQVLRFCLQMEGQTLHQQKDYNQLYCDNLLYYGGLNGAFHISVVCLYTGLEY